MSRAVPVRRYARAGLAALIGAAGLCACGGGGASPAPTVTVARTAGPSSAASANAAATAPAMVAVTTAGALVTLNPATGTVQKTLVPAGVIGDEISVSSAGQVYFAVQNGCSTTIEEVAVGGGPTAQITAGSLPAISPDGTKLAYASQPSLSTQCESQANALLANYNLKIRTLGSGTTATVPMVAAGCQCGGLPAPISHLSWAQDDEHLAVSVASVQDNEGWGVFLVDTAVAKAYDTGAGATLVPVTGQPTPQQSYLREGVYMPDGNLFVSRACCGGDPVQNTSRLMWEVNTSGVLVHQVALGYADLDHTSLDVSTDGNWLLYLAGNDLYVSAGGATPSKLTTGLIAAAWG